MPHTEHDPRRAVRGVKFLVFAVIMAIIALLRQVGIEPRSPLGLVLMGASIIALAVVMRYVLRQW